MSRPFPHDELMEIVLEAPRLALPQRHTNAPPQGADAPIIDLTGEPDSPPRPILHGRNHHGRFGRGQPPRRRSPLSFPTSNNGGGGSSEAAVIDLTRDSPERTRPPHPQLPRIPQLGDAEDLMIVGTAAAPPRPFPSRARMASMGRRHVTILERGIRELWPVVHFPDMITGQFMVPDHVQEHIPIDPNPFGEVPTLNYNQAAFGQGAQIPKSTPPPPAREGFTRDTGTDTVAVCPSCDEELEYDPDGTSGGGVQCNRKGKSKRDKSEHHFWALKSCGHVYCQECFENRRPTQKSPRKTHFRTVNSKLVCAVDECKTEVGPKGSWVGIYL